MRRGNPALPASCAQGAGGRRPCRVLVQATLSSSSDVVRSSLDRNAQVTLVQVTTGHGDSNIREVTKSIKGCQTWQQVNSVCLKHGKAFNHIHVSAAITHIAQLNNQKYTHPFNEQHDPNVLVSSSPMHEEPSTSHQASTRRSNLPEGAAQLMDKLLFLSRGHINRCDSRQLSNMLWAVAKCGHIPHPIWLKIIVSALARHWGTYDPQHVSNVAYALALLGYDPGKAWLMRLLKESVRVLEDFKPQELSNLLYALSLMSSRYRIGSRWLSLMRKQTHQCMQDFNGQELANLCWSMSRFHQADRKKSSKPASLTYDNDISQTEESKQSYNIEAGGYEESTQPPAHQAFDTSPTSPQAQTRTSENHAMHHAWMERLLLAAQLRLHAADLSPQAVCCILLSCAKMGHRPPDVLLRSTCNMIKQELRHQYCPQALSNLLLAFTYLGFRPQQDFLVECEAALEIHMSNQPSLKGTPTQGVSVKHKDFVRGFITRVSREELLPQHLANSLWSMAKMGWCPSPTYLHGHMQLCVSFLHKFKSSEVAQMLLALSALGIRPSPDFLELMCIQALPGSHNLGGREASVILHSLVSLGHHPRHEWLHQLSSRILPSLRMLPGRTLAMLMYSFGKLRYRPTAPWMTEFWMAVQLQLDALSSLDLSSIVWASKVLELKPAVHLMENAADLGFNLKDGWSTDQAFEVDITSAKDSSVRGAYKHSFETERLSDESASSRQIRNVSSMDYHTAAGTTPLAQVLTCWGSTRKRRIKGEDCMNNSILVYSCREMLHTEQQELQHVLCEAQLH
ncbi:hypothetical protein CEUSTIGMA_g1607.t1 [Chlamydomonas eustigma]|uniref:FAST kinase leucine-rich domain-containing protein n=1 Tax=Chlamydomonas eustigma TaxID=1157962 RepID=A0A250WTK4_9CHLO|nr:hypothetical protein CEUSTIGMA_g1607.t1 [Chlamydomonas eustigma]|eukprot:GAX74158.1 hypothetical protein CEUSTIGMA_g1607.t1 [Chlamydomonas eustigma]